MAGLTDTAEDDVLTWYFTTDAAPTRPTAWHAGLHLNSSPPTDSSPSTGELSGNGYARQSIGTMTVSGTAPTQAVNGSTLTFGPNTTTNWGTLGYVSVWSASSAGTCYAFGALSSTVTINVGDSLQIAASALVITCD
jgi:hypothetical protein